MRVTASRKKRKLEAGSVDTEGRPLEPGKRYRFEPFVSSEGIPVNRSNIPKRSHMFLEGVYDSRLRGSHVFRGFPATATGQLELARGEYYFMVHEPDPDKVRFILLDGSPP
jgi:hypothetical protein